MEAPRVSVIIPTYDRSLYLREALESIAAQTYAVAEVLIVDDCSPHVVELPRVPNLNIVPLRHYRNQGPGAARNTGLAHATGDWILFMDDDDLLTPGRIQAAVDGMGNSRMHACAVEYFYPNGTARSGQKFEGDLRSSLLDGTEPNGGQPAMGQVIVRREDCLQFDPSIRRAEDFDWWFRMCDRALFAWSSDVGLKIRRDGIPRDYISTTDYFAVRRSLAQKYGPYTLPHRRAHLYSRTAGAALTQGLRWQAMAWGARSLRARPTLLAAKQLSAAVLGRPER